MHCIEDAPNTGSSAWLISRLGHYSLTAASRSVFDICPDQREGADQTSTSPGYSSIQERQTFIALTKLQSTPKSIWQLPCGLATCVANVSSVYCAFTSPLVYNLFARSQQPGELLIIGIVQWTGQDSHGRDTSVFEAVLFFPPYH